MTEETRQEFENRIYGSETTNDVPKVNALVEVAWQLKLLNRRLNRPTAETATEHAERLMEKKVDPYAMEGTGVEMEERK